MVLEGMVVSLRRMGGTDGKPVMRLASCEGVSVVLGDACQDPAPGTLVRFTAYPGGAYQGQTQFVAVSASVVQATLGGAVGAAVAAPATLPGR